LTWSPSDYVRNNRFHHPYLLDISAGAENTDR
jgi:hypothetical protein